MTARVSFLFLLLLLVPRPSLAKWTRLPYLGLRPAGMGNAFIALADDRNALFYNPAGLTQLSGINFELYDLYAGGDSLDSLNRFNRALFLNEKANSIRSDIHNTRGGYFPAYFQPGFGMGVFTNLQTFTDIGNLENDLVDLYAASDLGFLFSSAMNLGGSVSVGATVKVLTRMGFDQTVAPGDLLASLGMDRDTFLNSIHDSLKGLQGKGWAYGFDLGILIREPVKRRGTSGSFALVITDVLSTAFRTMAGSIPPPSIPMGIHLGVGWTQRFSNASEWKIAFDIRNIGMTSVLAQMVCVGFEYKLLGFSVLFGAHQGQLTYGLIYENAYLRAGLVSLGAELGTKFFERPTRMYLLQLAFGVHDLRR